jgi:hypothetical protein
MRRTTCSLCSKRVAVGASTWARGTHEAQDKYILESRALKPRGLLREHNERLVFSAKMITRMPGLTKSSEWQGARNGYAVYIFNPPPRTCMSHAYTSGATFFVVHASVVRFSSLFLRPRR